jgi:pimeloyl-ACP methyl ester carboxylesterase
LVGHSLGANIAQVLAAAHRSEFAGVVLIDPARHDDLLEDWRKGDSAALGIDGCGAKCALGVVAQRTGLIRFATRSVGSRNYSPEEAVEYRQGLRKPSHLPTSLASLSYSPKTGVQTRAARAFGDLPLTILYSADTRETARGESEEELSRWHAATLDSMRVLATGSTRGRGPIVIPGVTHVTIVLDSASRALIVNEVMRMVRPDAP